MNMYQKKRVYANKINVLFVFSYTFKIIDIYLNLMCSLIWYYILIFVLNYCLILFFCDVFFLILTYCNVEVSVLILCLEL